MKILRSDEMQVSIWSELRRSASRGVLIYLGRRLLLERKPDRELEKRREGRARRSSDMDEFWGGIGLDVDSMSPTAQLTTSLAVLIPVVVASVAVLFFFTSFWWFVFFFGWALFPAFGLLLRGIAGLSEGEGRKEMPAGNDKERELLQALREHDEISPTQAAIETSLTVEEADDMLKDLASKGHLDVRVRGGGMFYGLWRGEEDESRQLEGDP
jgi:hypothetical protein